MTIKIALVDDHPVVRKGLSQFFAEEEDFTVVGEYGDGEAAFEGILQTTPDVALVDLRMPELSGLELVKKLNGAQAPTRVVILAGNVSDQEVLEAMRLGVRGVVLKEMAPSLLVQCVRKVHAGGTWLEKDAVGRLLDKILTREEESQNTFESLTPREREIVAMVVDGLSNKAIGERLFISEATVKSHMHTIFEKTGVSSRMQLANVARKK